MLQGHSCQGQAHDARVWVHGDDVLLQAGQQVPAGARHDGPHQRRHRHRQAGHLLRGRLVGADGAAVDVDPVQPLASAAPYWALAQHRVAVHCKVHARRHDGFGSRDKWTYRSGTTPPVLQRSRACRRHVVLRRDPGCLDGRLQSAAERRVARVVFRRAHQHRQPVQGRRRLPRARCATDGCEQYAARRASAKRVQAWQSLQGIRSRRRSLLAPGPHA